MIQATSAEFLTLAVAVSQLGTNVAIKQNGLT
jgi:hypothetical protein